MHRESRCGNHDLDLLATGNIRSVVHGDSTKPKGIGVVGARFACIKTMRGSEANAAKNRAL